MASLPSLWIHTFKLDFGQNRSGFYEPVGSYQIKSPVYTYYYAAIPRQMGYNSPILFW